jgi:hypothetical protein
MILAPATPAEGGIVTHSWVRLAALALAAMAIVILGYGLTGGHGGGGLAEAPSNVVSDYLPAESP